MAQNKWTMNDTQKRFMEVLGQYADGVTMFELKLAGHDFKTGSVNTLVTKGLVATDGEREFACEVVYNGQVVGKTTKTGKVYKLVHKDQFVGRKGNGIALKTAWLTTKTSKAKKV